MRSDIPLLAVFLLPFSLFPQHFNGQETNMPAAICDSVTNSLDCAAKIEKWQMALFAPSVKREGASLIFKLKNGGACELKDDDIAKSDAVRYHFRNYYPDLGYFEVHAQYAEGNDYLLIDHMTGRSKHIIGPPVISPDRARFIAVSEDLESGYNPNQIQVFKMAGGKLAKEMEFTPHNWGPRNPKWLGNDKITITKHSNQYDPMLNKWESTFTGDTLTLFGNRWLLRHE
jgi:hypothetical protein